MTRADPTPAAAKFIAANAKSPVVYGSGYPAGGGRFRLKDGSVFVLSLSDCRSMPMPVWDIPE